MTNYNIWTQKNDLTTHAYITSFFLRNDLIFNMTTLLLSQIAVICRFLLFLFVNQQSMLFIVLCSVMTREVEHDGT